jgi:hypothetical protein
MTESTPGGKPARSHNSAMIIVAPGSRSEGLMMSVLPAAMETMFQSGIIAGKLNGQTAAPTPRGSRRTYVSISFDTSILAPSSSFGIAHIASTTCWPRRTSPLASAKVLPCSRLFLFCLGEWWLNLGI